MRPLIDHEIIPDPPERSKGKGKGDKGKKGDDGEKGEDRGGLSDFEGGKWWNLILPVLRSEWHSMNAIP